MPAADKLTYSQMERFVRVVNTVLAADFICGNERADLIAQFTDIAELIKPDLFRDLASAISTCQAMNAD